MDIAKKIVRLFEDGIAQMYHSTPRTSQVQMALDVENFLMNDLRQVMFIEAPVGTGKTLGTLIPSILYCKEKHVRITYATATKNLQSQIVNGELPEIAKLHLMNERDAILAMGKSNYACLSLLRQNQDSFSTDRYREIEHALLNVSTGARDELEKKFSLQFSNKEWQLVSMAEFHEHCDDYLCMAHQLRKEFRRNHLITVTNHDMIIQSYLNELKHDKSLVPVMPGVLVIDEAHLFDENFLGRTQRMLSLSSLARMRDRLGSSGKDALNKIIVYFKNLNAEKYGKTGRHELSKNLRFQLKLVLTDLQKLESVNSWSQLPLYSNLLDDLTTDISMLLDEESFTSWVSVDDGDCFNMISNSFYEDMSRAIKFFAHRNKVIFLSGTLTATDNPVEELRKNWQLKKFVYKAYTTPFNVYDQAYIYTPESTPNPKSKDAHRQKVVEELRMLSNCVPGGILVLNNSLEIMDNIFERIGNNFTGRKVLKQGERSNGAITTSFKQNENSILLGSGSFFSGFSVPGKSLRTVIITTLPFPVPTDPFVKLQQRRSENGRQDDFSVLLNLMLKRLEQGIGRLIRQKDDFGVICITDPRMLVSNYSIDIQEWMERKKYHIHNGSRGLEKFQNKIGNFLINQKAIASDYDRSQLSVPIIVGTRERQYSQSTIPVVSARPENDEFEVIKAKVRKHVSYVRKKYSDCKIRLNGISNASSVRELAQILINAAFISGIDKQLLIDGLPISEAELNEIKPDPTLSGPVIVTHLNTTRK